MDRVRLIVRTESLNVWWGIHGFCEKTGWEDINIFNDKGEKIGVLKLYKEHVERFEDHG